jgi:hypothetical protein
MSSSTLAAQTALVGAPADKTLDIGQEHRATSGLGITPSSLRSAEAGPTPYKIAQGSPVDTAQYYYSQFWSEMPGKNGISVPYIGGLLNDLAIPFVEMFNRNKVPKDCSNQALYMASMFKQYGYDAWIHTGNGHAWFSVIIQGERWYGDTWAHKSKLQKDNVWKEEGSGYSLL